MGTYDTQTAISFMRFLIEPSVKVWRIICYIHNDIKIWKTELSKA